MLPVMVDRHHCCYCNVDAAVIKCFSYNLGMQKRKYKTFILRGNKVDNIVREIIIF